MKDLLRSSFILNVVFCKAVSLICLTFFAVNSVSAQVQFENTTESLGGPFHTGDTWGASWGHLNDDVYPDLYTSNHGSLASILSNNNGNSFAETIQSADLENIMVNDPHADIHGGTWADFDNDGDQDLFVTRSSVGARVYLFENDGNGAFQEKGGNYGVGGVGGGRMPLLFDYTNDGRLDINLARNGGNRLFKWEGSRFVEETNPAGIGGECHAAQSGAASDFFGTGSLYYLCASAHGTPYAAYDTGTLPFTDVADKFDKVGTTPDAVLGDFNNDLKVDIFALRGLVRPSGVEKISSNRIEAWLSVGGAVDYESTFTFKADGPITINVAARTVGTPSRVRIGSGGYHPSSMPFTVDPTDSNSWGTEANHQLFAVFVEYDEVNEEWTIYMSAGGNGGGEGAFITVDGAGFTQPSITGLTGMDLPAKPRFLLNNGNRLVDSNSRGIGNIQCGGVTAADFDNDMDVDLYLACRTGTANINNLLYLNDGAGNFSLSATPTGAEGLIGAGVLSGVGTAESAVTADYDVDGFVDLFVTNGNRLRPRFDQDGYSAAGPDQFYRNTTNNGNNWLQIDLEGVNSNRDGFGAKVIVTAGGVAQLREQNGQYHRWSHDHKRLHFGLADNSTADIRVEWPDGTIDMHSGVAAQALYRVIQDGALTDITPTTTASSISIDNVSIISGEDAELIVSLSKASPTSVTVDYVTVDGSAVSGPDYIYSSGTLTFAPNQTSQLITIPSIVNDPFETAEIFTIKLSNPSVGQITQSIGTITIIASESVDCGSPDYQASIDKGFFVWVDCNGSGDWSVRGTAGGAVATEYKAKFVSNSVIELVTPHSFEGNDEFLLLNSDKALDLKIKMINAGQDGLDFSLLPGSEMCISLADASQIIYLGANRTPYSSPLNVTTLNNNCASELPNLSVNDVSVSEADTSANVEIVLSQTASEVVNVSYSSQNDSAIAGEDYLQVSDSIDFNIGETTKIISVPILQDQDIEQAESFYLTISSSSNVNIVDGIAEVMILDDDLGIDVCGEPNYSTATDAGLFLWQDCGTTNKWLLRGTAGGGAAITYVGSFISNSVISSLSDFSFEGIDRAELSNADLHLDFLIKMANKGVDGIEFALETDSDTCFNVDLPAGLQVVVGQNNVLLTPPFDLNSLDPC